MDAAFLLLRVLNCTKDQLPEKYLPPGNLLSNHVIPVDNVRHASVVIGIPITG